MLTSYATALVLNGTVLEKGEWLQMKLFRRSTRALLAFAAAPIYWLEEKERKRKLEERLKRFEQKRALSGRK
jgi:hypothetical protein